MTDGAAWLKRETGVQSVSLPERESERTVRPALHALRVHQEGLRERLVDGFASREAVLQWAHAVSVVSLGQVDDGWCHDLLSDPWRMAALLADEQARQRVTAHAPSDEQAQSERTDIYGETLLAGFNGAVSLLADQKVEHDDEGLSLEDVQRQRWVMLRPALHEVATRQRRVLAWALDLPDCDRAPLRNRGDVHRWGQELVFAADGDVDDELLRRLASPAGLWLDALINPQSAMLELLLAEDVLPLFNETVRTVTKTGLEQPDTERDRTPPATVG
jgi:hypothetical protein